MGILLGFFGGGAGLGDDFVKDFGVGAQEFFGGFAALSDFFALVFVPGAASFDHTVSGGQIQDITSFRNTFVVHDVELGFAKRRRHFVLNNLNSDTTANHFFGSFYLRDAPDVHTHRRVKLQGLAAGGRLRIAEHNANLHAQLVDEHDCALGATNNAGQFAHGLTHQPSLQTHLGIAHVTLD